VEEVTHVIERPGSGPERRSGLSHISALDGFRGLAVLLVFFFHASQVSFQSRGLLIDLLGKMTEAGWVGVDLFFVLSGFLITRILISTLDAPSYFRNFYGRRTLRIFPLYYGVLLLLILVTPIMHFDWQGSLKYYLLYVQNYHSRWSGMVLSSQLANIRLEHLWSLAMEEQFYLVWPCLIYIAGRRGWLLAVPLVPIMLCPLGRVIALKFRVDAGHLYFWTPFRIDSLAWGALGAVVIERFEKRAIDALRLLSLVGGGAMCLFTLVRMHGDLSFLAPLVQKLFYSGIDMLSLGMILTSVRRGSWLGALLKTAWLRWFGRYSYGIYMFHLMLMGIGEGLRDAVNKVTGSRPLGALALVLGTLGATVALAYVSFNFYERPFLRLKDRFGSKPRIAEEVPSPA
jgi:peptidoglycan/LPS O-acetylase OafA/YrhL